MGRLGYPSFVWNEKVSRATACVPRLHGHMRCSFGPWKPEGHLSSRQCFKVLAVRHVESDISQRCREQIEELFGWIKTTDGVAQVKVRGLAKVQAVFSFAILAYNLVRIPKLLEAT